MIETLNGSQILSYLYHDFARSEEKIVCLQLFAHLGCKFLAGRWGHHPQRRRVKHRPPRRAIRLCLATRRCMNSGPSTHHARSGCFPSLISRGPLSGPPRSARLQLGPRSRQNATRPVLITNDLLASFRNVDGFCQMAYMAYNSL